jgi:hypothetical protein
MAAFEPVNKGCNTAFLFMEKEEVQMAILNEIVERCIEDCLQCLRWCSQCREESLTEDPVMMRECRKALLDDYATRGNKSLLTSSEGNEFICGLKALDAFFEYGQDKPGWPVTRITTDAAREFARKQQEAGLGNATINRSLALLRRMLNLAHEESKIQVVPKIRMLKEPPARKGFLPREQFNELLAKLPTS